MFPTVLQLGPLPIRSYGLMIALSFTIGIWLGIRRARKKGVDPVVFTDLCVTILLSSVVGARLAYVLQYWDVYGANMLKIFQVWEGGLTLYGGIIGAIIGSVVFARVRSVSFWKVADICAPLVALGIGITRIGCFLNGCCYGIPTGSPLGVVFPPGCGAGSEYPGIPIHPTQLYDSAFGFALFGILLLVEKKVRGDGRLFLLFLALYGLSRFFQDKLRYYDDNAILGSGGTTITVPQLISLGLFFGGLGLMALLGGKRAKED